MSAWLMSIVGVVSLGVLLEILLEDGQTSKYIKGVFAIAVVLVIVAPLPKFFNKEWSYEDFFSAAIHQPDNDFVDNIDANQLASVEKYLKIKLQDDGFNVIDIKIEYEANSRQIKSVEVWTKNSSNLVAVIDCVTKNINVEKSNVKIYNKDE